jgi:RNA polymerase sigma-70 factor (ECF subfamily)
MAAGSGKKDEIALQLTDEKLVRKLRDGDKEAFRAMVARHAQPLFKLAFYLLGNQQDAEDVVQETMLAAVKRIKSFEGRSALGTWLRSILMFQASKARRSRQVRRSISLDRFEEPADAGLVCESMALASDRQIDVEGMLGELSDEYRQVLVLRELQQLTYDEISQILRIPRGTVMSRLHRARQELKHRQQSYVDL